MTGSSDPFFLRNMIFSGFMSRCMIPFECMKHKVLNIFLMNSYLDSCKDFSFMRTSFKVNDKTYSTIYIVLEVSKRP